MKTRAQFRVIAQSMSECTSALAAIGDCASLITADLRAFLDSDSNEVPRSLNQMCKLSQFAEVQEAMRATTASVTRGITDALTTVSPAADAEEELDVPLPNQPILDRVFEILLTERGRSLIGIAVGVATKNATTTFFEYLQGRGAFSRNGSANSALLPEPYASMQAQLSQQQQQQQQQPLSSFGVPELLAFLTSEDGERLLSLLTTQSMGTIIKTYFEHNGGSSVSDDVMKAISKSEHRDAIVTILSRLTGVFVKEAADAYRQSNPVQQPAFTAPSQPTSTAGAMASNDGGGPLPPAASLTRCDAAERSLLKMHDFAASIKFRPDSPEGTQVLVASAPNIVPSGAAGGTGGPPQTVSLEVPVSKSVSSWLQHAAQMARERDLRALAVDVCGASIREATREAMSALIYGRGAHHASSSGAPTSDGMVVSQTRAPHVPMFGVYVLMCMLVSLFMYAVSPRLIVL